MSGDLLDLKIERIVPRGLGIGFADGSTIFVPLAAAGDVVRVRIAEAKKRTAFAEIVDVRQPSPDRITPPCPHFGVCGGCDFQQLSYEAQLAAKVGIIRDSLRRIGGIDYEAEINIIPSPNEFGYRSRARWHADGEDELIGYYARNSHDIVDVRTCPILTSPLEATLLSLKRSAPWGKLTGDTSEIEAAEDGGTISLYSTEIGDSPDEIATNVHGIEFAYSARTFFQGNRSLIPTLIDLAIDGMSGTDALDLYSGVGLFSLPLASRFERVTGVEANAGSIRFAKRNKARAGLANVTFVRHEVGHYLAEYGGSSLDLVLFDPPRSGADIETIRHLARIRPSHISYVSCDPAILARDVAILSNYSIAKITALDLFPQTHHVETVVHLELR